MSEQSRPYPQQKATFDPIGCVGVLFVLAMFVAVIVNVAEGVLGNDDPNSHSAIVAALPSTTPTTPPTAIAAAALPTRVVASSTPLTLPTITASATPPSPTPTVEPTNTPTTPPLPTETPIAPVQFLPDLINEVPATPIPLPTPSTDGDFFERVPILMYHYTSDPPANADKYRLDLSVTPANLREQLEWLHENGYTTISLYQLASALANVATLPEKSVILTFDDGHRDNYENAFPLLQEFGMTATFFIITDLPDEWNEQYMTWPMIQEMAAAGMDMEIHTRSHPDLRERDADYLADQIGYAQDRLAAETQKTPRFLAYPGGAYDDATIAAVQQLDLWGAVRTSFGIEHQFDRRYKLDRVRVRNSTSLWQFVRLLDGKY